MNLRAQMLSWRTAPTRVRNTGEASRRKRLHAVIYDEPSKAIAAVVALRRAGYTVRDVHTPFPVHGMAEAIGLAPTRISYATLGGAIAGVSLAVWLQVWTHVASWPLNIGGKDVLAWPALVPVTFELAVLLAAIATVTALAVRSRTGFRSDLHTLPIPAVTDDRFVVVVEERDGSFMPTQFRELAATSGCERVIEAWRIL